MQKQLFKDHDYHSINATIIADSKNEFGNRITTFVVTFPRIVLAEAKTHRILNLDDSKIEVMEDISVNSDINFSRNSASSRAVPFKKMVKMV